MFLVAVGHPGIKQRGKGMQKYYIYIVASKRNGTLYIGVTNNLLRRMSEHKSGLVPGFTQKHSVHNLVYFEEYEDIRDAIRREKVLKRWNRKWKIRLIEKMNPEWNDLSVHSI
jgi:putative endonuclease